MPMLHPCRVALLLLMLIPVLFGLGGGAGVPPAGRAATPESSDRVELAPFVPSPMPVVNAMLDLAGVTDSDVVYDLGSGDGRVVITAAKKYGARAVGFETNPDLVKAARKKAQEAGVAHLVEIREQDATTADLSAATVVTLYLFPEANMMLRPLLQQQLPAGARVVSSQFGMGDWRPEASTSLILSPNREGNTTPEDDAWTFILPRDYTIYLWRIDNHR